MIIQNLENGSTNCINQHDNPAGSEWCYTCGTAIVDYASELDLFIQTLTEQEARLKFVREKLFLGIGDQGCRLINDFYTDIGKNLKRSTFLMIDSSGDAQQLIDINRQLHTSTEYNSPISLHYIPGSSSKQVGYYGLGEHIAENDATLDDRLLRTGINASDGQQTVFLLSTLGGGTGSGVSPYTLERIKVLNPETKNLVIAIMPAVDEPDSAHFNAFCSLSRLIRSDNGPSADMIMVIDHDRLMKARGIGSMGEELASEAILSHLIEVLAAANKDLDSIQTDPDYLCRMSRSMGIQVFIPCLAVGRSMEIFGTITNILESALASPLSPIDPSDVLLSYALVQVPQRILSSLREEVIRTEINKWNKDKFPKLKGSIIQISQSAKGTDRIELCLLLGGNRLALTAEGAKQGFDRFRIIAEKESWEQEFAVPSRSMDEIEHIIEFYDNHLDELAA